MATYEDEKTIYRGDPAKAGWDRPAMKMPDPPAMQQIAELREQLDRLMSEFKEQAEATQIRLGQLEQRLG